jgi:hypothetical protein
MSEIDSMHQNPGEWFPVSLDEVRSTKLDFERRGIPVDPEWSGLLLTAPDTGLKIQASLQDGRVPLPTDTAVLAAANHDSIHSQHLCLADPGLKRSNVCCFKFQSTRDMPTGRTPL